jgi:hypothetical protein
LFFPLERLQNCYAAYFGRIFNGAFCRKFLTARFTARFAARRLCVQKILGVD